MHNCLGGSADYRMESRAVRGSAGAVEVVILAVVTG
jgi:hypothetical protein